MKTNTAMPSMLIEKYLPTFDVREYHELAVQGEPERAYAALRSVDFNHSRLIRTLFAVRTLPGRLLSRGVNPAPQFASFLETAVELGWVILEELPGRELVAGAITQPWAPVVRFVGLPAPEFVAFAAPGFAKIVWTLGVHLAAGSCLLSTETRVLTTDAVSRRKFRRYWFVFSPGIRLIRHAALNLAKRHLEQSRRAA